MKTPFSTTETHRHGGAFHPGAWTQRAAPGMQRREDERKTDAVGLLCVFASLRLCDKKYLRRLPLSQTSSTFWRSSFWVSQKRLRSEVRAPPCLCVSVVTECSVPA